jgi:hypothetical protein
MRRIIFHLMPDAQEPAEPTQPTQPKKGKPIEIPVPKRADVLKVFEKAAKTPDPENGSKAS